MIAAELLAYALIGAFSGVAAGLLGIGGGLIIIPFLLISFDYFAVIPFAVQAHVAVATSLATIIFTALSAIYSQQQKKAIDWSIVLLMAPGIVLGSFLGAWIASYLPRQFLLLIFSGFVLMVGLKMWFGWSPHSRGKLPGAAGMGLVALMIGMISAIVGIGGGTMTVPFLHWGRIVIQRAIAISSALGLPIAVSGTLGFYMSSLSADPLQVQYLWGYVYLPAFAAIISLSVIAAPAGVYLSHKLSKQRLGQVFSILLIILAVRLLAHAVI
mgnify:FL=1